MKALTNKIVLVAGGTGNVGEGIVRAFLEADALVIVPYRNEAKLERLRQYVADVPTGNLLGMFAEMDNLEGVRTLQGDILRRFQHIDIAVASLGGWQQGLPLTSVSMETWDTIVKDNLTAHFLAIKAFIPLLSPQTGVYIHINGQGSELIAPMAAPVAAMAAAQKSMVLTMAQELSRTKIRVYEFILGVMRTRERLSHGHDHEDWYSPIEVGEYITALYEAKIESHTAIEHRMITKTRPSV